MASLYNVKKLVINGNEINKVAKHYNANMVASSKLTTAVTIQALEEAIAANKIECDFEYNKKHETNMTYNEIIVKDVKDTNTALDNAYNILINKDSATGTFTYDSGLSLKEATHESVYLASVAKDFDKETFYTLDDGIIKIIVDNCTDDPTVSNYSISLSLDSGSVSMFNVDFFDSAVAIASTLNDVYIDKYCNIKISSVDYTEIDYTSTAGVKVRIPNKTIYIKNNSSIDLYGQDGTTTAAGSWKTNYITGATVEKCYYKLPGVFAFTDVSSDVKEIIVAKDIDNFNFEKVDGVTIRGYAFNLTAFGTTNTKGKLYTQGTYAECGLGDNVSVNVTLGTNGELHLSSNFFDYADLDEVYKTIDAATSPVYPFGNFSSFNVSSKGKLFIERSDLNTTKTSDADLNTLMQKILKTQSTITFETL